MIKLTLALASVLATFAVGCGGGAEELVKASKDYETASCSCKDVACVQKATTDYSTATQALAGKNLKPTAEDAQKIGDSTTKASACMTKISMAAIPGH